MGTLNFMRCCFPYLKEQKGAVINMGSIAGVAGSALFLAYAPAKEAIRAASRVAAREWGQFGINVNVICPVAVTDAFAEAMENPEVRQRVEARTVLGYAGLPDKDVAPVAVFLASEDARYMTGHTFMVDGGSSIDAGR